MNTLVTVFLAAAIAGISGYLISFRFNRSNYAATNTCGDFGTPRGSFILTFAGMLIGMAAISLLSRIPNLLPEAAVSAGFISAMISGAVAGLVGLVRGKKAHTTNKP
jgi:uncharacterized membrane-anchored protein